ncbi:F-box/LRR-repeat protein 7 [Toxocara canis]|uniref:F-box/LRR-repeat protein 7 n=1 Tax=Toxocara canis TaxID=6265 RepID=A0A0B2V720_TOXCA|nr:F-box/LRR-repeat protein 7 [Toxocara canis]
MRLLEHNVANFSRNDGTMAPSNLPFSEEFLNEQEKYRFSEWYPRMGGGCSLNSLYSVHMCQHVYGQGYDLEDFSTENKLNGSDSTAVKCMDVSMEDLPDIVLIEIFRFLHPIDRVHSASLVCKRWNRLLYAPKVWTEVRVIVYSYSVKNGSAKRFLARVAASLQKLCLCLKEDMEDYPKASEVEDLLPSMLPQLTLLDIGYFPGLTSSLLSKIDACMPNLQRLNMEHAFSASCYDVLFSESKLANVRELILCGWGFTAHKIEALFHVRKKLEVFNADEASNTTGIHSRNWKGFDEVVARSPLKRLYVRGFFRPNTLLRELQNFENLTLLSFTYAGYMGPEDILPIKRLSRLEHLHLGGNYDDYSRMTTDCLRTVFGPAETEADFPSRLKFLSLPYWRRLDDSVIAEITLNCQQLRSLCIARCPMVTKYGFIMIAKRLRQLRLLDVNWTADAFDASTFYEIGHDDFPQLIYLSVHSKQSPASHDEMRCSLRHLMARKRTLLLSDEINSFVTYKISNGQMCFNDYFIGYVGKIANELARIEGFCCMSQLVLVRRSLRVKDFNGQFKTRSEAEIGTAFNILSMASSMQTNPTTLCSSSSSPGLSGARNAHSSGTAMTVVEALSTGSPAVLKDLIKRKLTSSITEEQGAKLRRTEKDYDEDVARAWMRAHTKYFELKAEKTRLEIVKLRRELGM